MPRLTLAQASTYIERALQEAAKIGIRISVAVVDEAGHLVALQRMDGAGWVTTDIAYGKAYTAAAFGAPSADVAERWRDASLFAHAVTVMTHGRLTPRMGGLPIKIGEELAGAIGASGGTGEQDVQVVKAALGMS